MERNCTFYPDLSSSLFDKQISSLETRPWGAVFYQNKVRIDCSRPGKPKDNAFIESLTMGPFAVNAET